MNYLRKLYGMWREHGFAKTLLKLGSYVKNNFINIYFDSYYVFEKNLDKGFEIEKPRINLDIVQLNKCNYQQSVNELIRFWPGYFRYDRIDDKLREDIDNYFECDDECFLALYNREIIAMLWLGYQNNYMLKSIGKKLGLKEDEVIMHRVYVNNEFRKNNIYAFLGTYAFNYVKNKNYNRAITYVGTNNINSIFVNMKINDRCRFLYHIQVCILVFRINLFPKFTKTYLWERN